jgi:Transglycosylase SLT domain
VHHWTETRAVGAEFALSPTHVAQAIAAIVMAESWFEHRAFNVNRYGNRDLGLAQCSDYCRRTIAAMAAAGELPFSPSEADYFDPRIGSYIATVWFERELRRADGDVSLAIRSYHRGLRAAMDEKGDLYLSKVERLRDRYIRTQGASPSWAYLTARIAAGRATRRDGRS